MGVGREIKAGGAYVELFTKDGRYRAGLRNAQRRLQAFGATAIGIGRQVAMATAVLAAPLLLGGKAFADYEKQLANVSTMLDDTAHMDRYRAGVRALSIDVGESTETLSKGLYDILSASIAPAKALDVLTVAAKSAKAGMTDTGTAADAITTILNAYSLSADQAESVSDLLFAVVKRGKTTFAELAPSIGLVATNAATAGVSLEELGASVATLTRVGIKTENAITSVNRVIMTFLKPSDQAAAYAKTLGFELSSATLKAEGIVGVFQRIAALPPDAVAKLFPNIRALRGVLPALKSMEDLTGDIDLMANRAGRMEEAYAKMTATISHGFDQAKQAGVKFLAAIGKSLGLKELTGQVKTFLLSITEWVEANPGFISGAARLAVTLGGVGVAMIAVGVAAKAMAAAVFVAMNPIVALGALVAVHAVGWSASMAATSQSMADARKEADATRAADLKLMESLEDLAGKQHLTNAELENANSILLGLEAKYGNLGVKIDQTTGKITGLTTAQKKLNAAMTAGRIADLQAEAMETKAKISKLMEEEGGSNLGTILTGFFTGQRPVDVAKQIKGQQRGRTKRARAYLAQYAAIQAEITALESGEGDVTGGGGKPGETSTGGTPTGDASIDPHTAYLEKNAELQHRIRELKLQDIEDAEKRELAILRLGYEKKIALARKEGRDLHLLDEAALIEERQLFEKYQKEREEANRDIWADWQTQVDAGANRLAEAWRGEARSREVRGMFSTAALNRQGIGSKTSEEKNTKLFESMDRHLDTLARRATTGGIVFAAGN